MEFTQIKETCLYIEDLDRSEQFYHGLLKLPIISKVEARHVFFRCGGSVLLCFLNKATIMEERLPPHYAIGRQHIALEVPMRSYQDSKQELLDAGIELIHTEPWGSKYESFYFYDPDGHVLEIVPTGMWD
jgi:catechol 2,3-dioxygenase-like lactoylglutathione lyase family enzyme